jgi:hypothetical protein
MQILVDVNRSGEGRLIGDVRPADGGSAAAFSGTIELLALIEELCPPYTAFEE